LIEETKANPVFITESGHFFVRPENDTDRIVDYIIRSGYEEEFVVSDSFDPRFLASLMYSGFLVMSVKFDADDGEDTEDTKACKDEKEDKDFYILLPKHHIKRSVLFFENLHTGKTIKKHLSGYELRAGADYDTIVKKCIQIHGDDWLTEPLVKSMRLIRNLKDTPVLPYSFGLYENNKLIAGEFGVLAGRVYTSYSGYFEKSNCGKVQMILTAQYLRDNNFAFWDLGMPLDYKYSLGAKDIGIAEFFSRFRAMRG
jgi:Leu/Phe-tRNA-protein transferase